MLSLVIVFISMRVLRMIWFIKIWSIMWIFLSIIHPRFDTGDIKGGHINGAKSVSLCKRGGQHRKDNKG